MTVICGNLPRVVLCMWKAEKIDADPPNLHLIQPFYLYNDADIYYDYNLKNSGSLEILLPIAQEYLQRHSYPHIDPDHMIKQHVHINSVRHGVYGDDPQLIRSIIMLNIFHTVEAYLAAVNYRVCVFFYRNVNINWLKSDSCLRLSLYMEWYFSFMFEQKVEDFCNIKTYFRMERNKQFNAEYVCKILKNLNLNFLRFPEEKSFSDLLQVDQYNVFHPNILSVHDPEKGEMRFISIFELFQVPPKHENQSQDDYDKTVYNGIKNLIKTVYTENFAELLDYFSQVTTAIPHPPNIRSTIPEFETMKIIWNYAPMFAQIATLPTQHTRGVVSFSEDGNITSNIGNRIYRSNAIEILRQISYSLIRREFLNAGVRFNQIIKNINASHLQCGLMHAPRNLPVDYYFKYLDVPTEVHDFLYQYN